MSSKNTNIIGIVLFTQLIYTVPNYIRRIYYETHTHTHAHTYHIIHMIYLFSNYYFTSEQPSSVDVGGARLTSAGQVRTLLFSTRGFPPSTHPLAIPGCIRKKIPTGSRCFSVHLHITLTRTHTRAHISEWAISF